MSGLALPEAFAAATEAAHANLLERPTSKRRVADRRDLRRVRDQARGGSVVMASGEVLCARCPHDGAAPAVTLSDDGVEVCLDCRVRELSEPGDDEREVEVDGERCTLAELIRDNAEALDVDWSVVRSLAPGDSASFDEGAGGVWWVRMVGVREDRFASGTNEHGDPCCGECAS